MREIVLKGVYKHFKGDYYLVEDIAYDSETKEKVVVYRRLLAMDHYGLDHLKCF